MIKITPYVDIAFFYRKAKILHRWSNILWKLYCNKGLCHCCRSHRFRWKLACFMLPLSSCNIKISVVSWCRILVAVQYMHSCLRFYSTDNLHLLNSSVTWLLLTRTDADWTCWLTAASRVRKHKPKFETYSVGHLPQHTLDVHCLQIGWLLLARQLWQGRTAASSVVVSWRYYAQEMLNTGFQEITQSKQVS